MRPRNTLPLLLIAGVLLVGSPHPVGAASDDFGPPTPPRRSRPQMRLDSDTFDWGKTMHGDSVKHSFKVYNDGEGVLKIIRVKST